MPHSPIQKLIRPDVADGSKADLTAPKSDFRYTPESGLKTDIAPVKWVWRITFDSSRAVIRS
jgi:hypothetical protein